MKRILPLLFLIPALAAAARTLPNSVAPFTASLSGFANFVFSKMGVIALAAAAPTPIANDALRPGFMESHIPPIENFAAVTSFPSAFNWLDRS